MPRFVQLMGDRAGHSYPAAEGAVLGRDRSCEVSLSGGSISRRHARLIFRDGDWQLVDMDSRNGLFLGARKVASCVLHGGEEVKLGKLRLRFHLDDGEDRVRPESLSGATGTSEDLTHMLQAPTAEASRSSTASPATAAERRTEKLAELRGGSCAGLLGGDLFQRAAWIRWTLYLLVLTAAVAAGLGAFYLVQLLRS